MKRRKTSQAKRRNNKLAMNENVINDEHFGVLRWDTELEEWDGMITISSCKEAVGLGLPPEYAHSIELRKHIRETVRIIERNELRLREKAASELYTNGDYILYWFEDQPFDHDKFVQEMGLGRIYFDFPSTSLTLGYEYAEGIEDGISVFLTWNGVYQSARCT
jgi:hypothetical protein